MIAGVGKAGTTSLFWYLSQHPDICASRVKEPRYFRFTDGGDASSLDDYRRYFDHCGAERYAMEASPQYFKGGPRTIQAIRTTLEDPRVILMFRDPVDRMCSEYRFKKSHMAVPDSLSFDGYVAECERVRDQRLPRTEETIPYWTFAGGPYVAHLTDWLDAFGDALMVGFFEDLVEDPQRFVRGICRWLGVDEAVASTFTYSIENRSTGYRSRALHRLALAMNAEGLLRSRRYLKVPLRSMYRAVNRGAKNERMSAETEERLRSLFGPSNAEMAAELRRRGYARLPYWLRGGADKPTPTAV